MEKKSKKKQNKTMQYYSGFVDKQIHPRICKQRKFNKVLRRDLESDSKAIYVQLSATTLRKQVLYTACSAYSNSPPAAIPCCQRFAFICMISRCAYPLF